MFAKLLPDQITKNWGGISVAIKASLKSTYGPENIDASDKLNRILEQLMLLRMSCWASYDSNREGSVIDAIVITYISSNVISGLRDLNIFCIHVFKAKKEEHYQNILNSLSRYAAGKKCDRLVLFTDNQSLVDAIEACGGNASFRFASIPLQ